MDIFKDKIESIYEEYRIPKTFPVPLIKISKELGYKVYTFKPSFETLNIFGIVNYAEREILLNKSDLDKRQRFTLAHEIGHIVLHDQKSKEEIVDYRKDILNPQGTKEREANKFAAELLMPEDEFRKQFANNMRV